MRQESYGPWLKILVVFMVLFLLVVSYFLYTFLFDYNSDYIGTSILPLEDLDIDAYQQLKE